MSYAISQRVSIADEELSWHAIYAQGKGGQNVNKVATAVHLRFDIKASSLPEVYKEKLLALKDRRLTQDGVIVIKAQRFRSQEKNRADAIERLIALIQVTVRQVKQRRATKPSRAAKTRRLDSKNKRGQTKQQRRKPSLDS